MSERRPIPGLPDGEISLEGKVWRQGKAKATPISAVGYRVVNFSIKNKSHTRYIHRLLLEVFVGPCPEGCEVLHINGDRLDNRLENLRWGTHKENVADAIRHGTATVGTRNSEAKLRSADLGWIKDMHAMGFAYREIAPHFNVTSSTIGRVVTGQTYAREI